MTIIPASGSRSLRLRYAANSFSQSATFRTLVGAADPTAALAKIYLNLSADDGSMPKPRLILRHFKAVDADREGTDTFIGKGQMLAFVQFDVPSDTSIIAKYSLPGDTVLTIEDHRADLDNTMGNITIELTLVATTAGCLEVHRWEEFSCGLVDPEENNGEKFYEMVWVVHYEGQL